MSKRQFIFNWRNIYVVLKCWNALFTGHRLQAGNLLYSQSFLVLLLLSPHTHSQLACKQALYLGDIVKSRCVRGTREEIPWSLTASLLARTFARGELAHGLALNLLWLRGKMRYCSQSPPAGKETENEVFIMKHKAFSFMATEPMVAYWFWMKISYLPCRFNNIDNNNENDNDDDDDDDKLFTLIRVLFFIGDERNRLQYDPFYTNTEARKVEFFIFLSRSTSRQSCTSLTRWEEGYIWWNKSNNNIKLYAINIIKKKIQNLFLNHLEVSHF